MDLAEILSELRKERDQINEMILAFERLARIRGRGQPPAWVASITGRRRGRPAGSKSKASAKAAGITATP
jgi:hypothetical protein